MASSSWAEYVSNTCWAITLPCKQVSHYTTDPGSVEEMDKIKGDDDDDEVLRDGTHIDKEGCRFNFWCNVEYICPQSIWFNT